MTDAHLVLGWMDPARMAGGRVSVSLELARAAIGRLAAELGTSSVKAAEGIVRVAEANMAGAIWRITCERGRDPRQFALVAFGGAGPLHAASLASGLGIRRVIVPPAPGAFSAFGMLRADLARHSTLSLLRKDRAAGPAEIDSAIARLAAENRRELGLTAGRGRARAGIRTATATPAIDQSELHLRYRGQSYEIAVPFSGLSGTVAAFHEEHRRLYGHADSAGVVELVSVGVRTVVLSAARDVPLLDPGPSDPRTALIDERRIWWRGWTRAGFYERRLLKAGAGPTGPAVVLEETSTTLVPPGFSCRVHASGCLVIEAGPRELDPTCL